MLRFDLRQIVVCLASRDCAKTLWAYGIERSIPISSMSENGHRAAYLRANASNSIILSYKKVIATAARGCKSRKLADVLAMVFEQRRLAYPCL